MRTTMSNEQPSLAGIDPDHVDQSQERADRADQLLDQEWEMAQQFILTARDLLRRFRIRPGSEPSIADITRMLDLASRLGRLSTGLQTDTTEMTGKVDIAFRVELDAALKKSVAPPPPPSRTPISHLPSSIFKLDIDDDGLGGDGAADALRYLVATGKSDQPHAAPNYTGPV
jgi:hypothetical protein